MPQKQMLFTETPDQLMREWWADPTNPGNPLSGFVGNEKAVKRLSRAAFIAFKHENHLCAQNFALFGASSTGKTMLARLFADTLQLPIIELSPDSVESMQDVFTEIKSVLARTEAAPGVTLELVQQNDKSYILPPCVIFIDEVHTLARKKRLASGLLKSIALNDRVMRTESGERINAENVCWIIATTEREEISGIFSGAFVNRFRAIALRLYSKAEIAEIISRANDDLDMEICKLVAKYCSHVPREALDFANEMRDEYELHPGSWEDAAHTVAEENNITECGLTAQRLEALKLLGRGPISKEQLATMVGVGPEEMRTIVMPPLQAITPDQTTPLVIVTSKGYSITVAGLETLDKCGVKHLGINAIPDQSRLMFGLDEPKENQRIGLN